MQKTDFMKDWSYKKTEEGSWQEVTLPHDAMLCEKRDVHNPGIHNIGYFEGHDYVYQKRFFLPEGAIDRKLLLQFEGVYKEAKVCLNGKKIGGCDNGYTDFFADLAPYTGTRENLLTVYVHNADQPNSRWYTGSGIYRPVWLWSGPKEGYILPRGIRIRTLEVKTDPKDPAGKSGCAKLGLWIRTAGNDTAGPGEAFYRIIDPEGKVVASGKALAVNGEGPTDPTKDGAETIIELKDAMLWDDRHPLLYRIIVRYGQDEAETSFGIRSLHWDRSHGLQVNGRRVILRGACIHSDNQLLGAITDPDAEERRVRLLKKCGYNAIRSAHNPASVYLLEACDKLGVYVMDEYTDMWYIHKTRFDYAGRVEKNYRQDLLSMVEKDQNHPCVILYSTGNEVAETGEKRGITLTRTFTEYLHSLDETRPVTCGINIFFNLLYSMGFGVYSDEKAQKEENDRKKKAVGSEFYNQLAGLMGDTFMKRGAALHASDVKTRDAFAALDIAGYNYGILRYQKDLVRYPKRLILGSETFCKDAYRFYEMAKKNPGILGDFVWAGMDYLGEAGIGAWEYEDYAPKDGDKAGWLTAGSGRLDITGKPGGEAYYTRVALGREKGPRIAVVPVYQRGKHSPSAWKLTNALRSWSYRGCEGKMAEVEVYARAAKVELHLNGKCLGAKKAGKDCIFRFRIPYESGCLEAAAYDKQGILIGEDALHTAGKKTKLSILPEKETVCPGKLLYVRLRYTDETGIWKPMKKGEIKVETEGGSLLALGNGCPYNPDGYLKDHTKTYYGEALAVIRAGEGKKLTIRCREEGSSETAVKIVDIRE